MLTTAQRLLQGNQKIKNLLDNYAEKYDTIDFIKNDPSKYIHLCKNPKDIEIAGFLASMFSYGKRELFMKKLDTFLTKDIVLSEFIKDFDENDELLKGFDYRFSKGIDFIAVLKILQQLDRENESLGTLYKYHYEQTKTISGMLQGVTNYFYTNLKGDVTQGFYHLLPNPSKKGAMKRMNMMLRWFVRKSPVDVGIWNFIDKSELIIPLDVHVANISRQIGLLERKNNDMKSAVEITENLKLFDPNDPVKYDFALFGIGVNGIKTETLCE